MIMRLCLLVMISVAASFAAQAVQEHNHAEHRQHDQHHTDAADDDTRTLVRLPASMRIHTLANMRDHLLAVSEIQTALAQGEFDKAGEIAEQRLGMSSLGVHGAHKVGQFMPESMQDMGTAMHRTASRFAVIANDAAVSGDVKPALAALSRVTQSCVACHRAFRYQ